MEDVEIVVFNDKSWVRLTEYQKLDEENKQLAKRVCELQSDLSRAKSLIEKKMICCRNCEYSYKENGELRCDVINCLNFDKWRLTE